MATEHVTQTDSGKKYIFCYKVLCEKYFQKTKTKTKSSASSAEEPNPENLEVNGNLPIVRSEI